MKRVYLDSSAAIAVLFRDDTAPRVAAVLRRADRLVSASLFVPEVLAALARERRTLSSADGFIRRVALFNSQGSLRLECEEALSHGVLRGADLAHLAAAMELAGRKGRKALSFCSLDGAQRDGARQLGFRVVP